MSDAEVIKRMLESKAEQKLRESINEEREFSATTSEDTQVLEKYKQMDESGKQQFMQKGWKNG